MFMYPTFNAQNTTPVGLAEESIVTFSVYPNPASTKVSILFSEFVTTNVVILDLTGKIILNEALKNTDSFVFDVSAFQSGLYLVTTAKGEVKKLVIN